ncbi:RING-H2 finger protein ATL65-like [Phoenix dactylifera]|uniref:RING-type E3 ubiquitin transferase n=1 Tax=Phoenix dactylifera TaxID=42345 RepID=A0A8B7CYT8_PHODC|nr:RING-H2 finger protein ATL65-like [Phoenix dactylifera]
MAAPAKTAEYEFEWGPSPATPDISPLARITHDISPPLIAMIAVVGTALVIVLCARILSRYLHRWRRWRRRRLLLQSTAAVSDLESPPPPAGGASFGSSSGYFLSPYGLDDSAIKTLPLSLYSKSRAKHLAATNRECAVCLLEFEDDDSLRLLPLCSHAFHVDCIDVWLRSHASCPLCRAAVFHYASPFVPMGAARIRPSLDDLLLDPPPEFPPPMPDPETEIVPAAAASPPSIRGVDRFGFRDLDFLLKRSYSLGFERSLAADRMVHDASTASPWR